MKQTQLAIAVVLLAVMVFVVSFAMHYLGGSGGPPREEPTRQGPRLELIFAHKVFPHNEFAAVEREERSKGEQDYWFYNPHDTPVKLGLSAANCKCTSVEGYALSTEATKELLGDRLAQLEESQSLAAALSSISSRSDLESMAQSKPLKGDLEYVEVPPHAVGWVRLRYSGEKPGKQTVQAKLWMDNPRVGQTATLELRLNFLEALRVLPILQFGTLKQEQLDKSVSRDLICLSPTRPSLKLEVKAIRMKGTSENDPVVIGQPVALTEEERNRLQTDIQTPGHELAELGNSRIQSAYRIPITLKPVAPDGKTPFDLGHFRRRILISASDVEIDPRSVMIRGRIRGLVELGEDDEGGEINLRVFPRKFGKRDQMLIQSEEPGVKLEVDRSRMPEYLEAKLIPGKPVSDGRQSWMLRVEVLPEKASGPFPRKDDPLYEDSAVYLNASIPGKSPRSVRIPVSGTASEG